MNKYLLICLVCINILITFALFINQSDTNVQFNRNKTNNEKALFL